MIASRSQRCSHSSMLWLVSTTDWPFFWILPIMFHKFLLGDGGSSLQVYPVTYLATGSTPVLGSSRKTSGGSPAWRWGEEGRVRRRVLTRVMATFSFRLLPPL